MKARTRTRIFGLVLLSLVIVAIAGCTKPIAVVDPVSIANSKECGGADCHATEVDAQAVGPHSAAACTACHQGTGEQHAKNPKTAIATTDWRIDSCKECHAEEVATYLYDDNAQAGPFGGSTRVPPQPKVKTFPAYNTIVAGSAFAKDYNEEGAHSVMLEDHFATTRGKFDTCVQCKSTKVAKAFQTGKPIYVASDTTVTLTHTATGTVPAKKVFIPKGTKLSYATDPITRRVDSKALFPDGTMYSSKPSASDDATKSYNMMWAATIAAIQETMPYGASCSHCHDPHTTKFAYVRQAMVQSIEGTGGVKGAGGVNPYVTGSPKKIADASLKDQRILTCSQCHVEYTCGKSTVDGIERDAYGWSKAKDLHELYTSQFNYTQDWKQKIIEQPLIKSQHPETELYWQSVHYNAGASCGDCHMPEVKSASGRILRSHWFTSPYKYQDAKYFKPFAKKTGLNPAYNRKPCATCHADREAAGIAQQRTFFARQAVIEKLLVTSVGELGRDAALKKAGGTLDPTTYAEAVTSHRKAHVLWENLAVSENSMGFHNFEEVMASMDVAETEVRNAIAKAKSARGGK